MQDTPPSRVGMETYLVSQFDNMYYKSLMIIIIITTIIKASLPQKIAVAISPLNRKEPGTQKGLNKNLLNKQQDEVGPRVVGYREAD